MAIERSRQWTAPLRAIAATGTLYVNSLLFFSLVGMYVLTSDGFALFLGVACQTGARDPNGV